MCCHSWIIIVLWCLKQLGPYKSWDTCTWPSVSRGFFGRMRLIPHGERPTRPSANLAILGTQVAPSPDRLNAKSDRTMRIAWHLTQSRRAAHTSKGPSPQPTPGRRNSPVGFSPHDSAKHCCVLAGRVSLALSLAVLST